MRRRWAVAIAVRDGEPLTFVVWRRYWRRQAAQRRVNAFERNPNPFYVTFAIRLED